jgi:hypothetical protein
MVKLTILARTVGCKQVRLRNKWIDHVCKKHISLVVAPDTEDFGVRDFLSLKYRAQLTLGIIDKPMIENEIA